MAADRAGERTVQPDAEIRAEALVQLLRHSRQELPDLVSRPCRIHPWQPLSEVFAIPVDGGEQNFGVFQFELFEFETVGYLAPKHLYLRLYENQPLP